MDGRFWVATMAMRFVQRGHLRILQQQWKHKGTGELRWFDVPLVHE